LCKVACPAGQTNCSDVCVVTSSDTNNCGACGNVCAGGQSCVNGVCTLVCGAGLTPCGNQCVNTATDASNCGGCGVVCPANQVCSNGVCQSINLNGVYAQYPSEGRTVYLWKTPVPCADLSQYTSFCQSHGLTWWAPKSQPDAQQLVTFAYNLDQTHTWIQTYNSVVTNSQASTVNGYSVTVDSPGCVESSTSGWTAFRKWGCSYCDPESNAQQNDGNQSCCWDKGHPYDWFVCQD
jgi:hypothetical protein